MNNPKFDAKLRTEISVKPSGAQVYLVALVLVAALCLTAGFIFLWYGRTAPAGIALLIGIGILLSSKLDWRKAQLDTVLQSATPTQIVQNQSGVKIIADPRILAHAELTGNLSRIFSIMTYRRPIPEPDGLVDKSGKPISNSKDEAVEIVRRTNHETQKQTSKLIDRFGIRKAVTLKGEAQPILIGPKSQATIATNLPSESPEDLD